MMCTVYPRMMHSNPIKDSFRVHVCEGIMAVVATLPASATILTFKQSEKAELIRQFPEREIYTIHEAEGITRKHIVLVRLHCDESFLYKGLEDDDGELKLNNWLLVGISRHNTI